MGNRGGTMGSVAGGPENEAELRVGTGPITGPRSLALPGRIT